MWDNFERREAAAERAEELEAQNHEIHKAYINKWEEYREKKIQLIAIFIKVLKKKNYLRRWLRLQKAGEIYKHVVENLLIRREFNRIKRNRFFVRDRFAAAYLKFQKQHGLQMDTRKRNDIRRCLNFAAAVRHQAIEDDRKQYFTKFLIHAVLAEQGTEHFEFFVNRVEFI